MTGFTPQMDDHLIIVSGVVQGLGLVFVPLSTVAFATLDPQFRTDATSLFSLVRNIGSSIGISIVTVVLTRNTQINLAELAVSVTPYNPSLIALSPAAAAGDPAALSQIDQMVNAQIDHAELAVSVTPYNPILIALSPAAAAGDPAALLQIDQMVNAQAAMIAYISDFKLMVIVTLAAMPLVLFLRKPKSAGAGAPAVPHMD